MRLTPAEHAAIVEEIRGKLPTATIYLYGSRTDDNLRGGDIDLLAIAADAQYMDRIDILLAIKSRIGEQKIDLKIMTPGEAQQDVFVQSVLSSAIQL